MRFWFPAKKYNSSHIFFWFLGKKLCRKMFGIVRHGRQICILVVQRIFLKTKQISRSNMTFFNIFRAQYFLTSDELFPALLTKLHFTCTEDHPGWKDTFLEKNECFYLLGLRAEYYLTVADLFSALLSKRQHPSPEHFFEHLFEHFYFFYSVSIF